MSRILIRDDDIGFFTDVERFKRVHRILLENHIPFNCAVIPNVRADVRFLHGGYEGFIPDRFQGRSGFFPVPENSKLVAFLRKHPFIEIAQHGFSHQRTSNNQPEFAGENSIESALHLEEGAKILEDTFQRKPLFFVPPYDTISRPVMNLVRKRYMGISLSRMSRHLIPIPLWPKYLLHKKTRRYVLIWNGFHVIQHTGIDFSYPESVPKIGSFEDILSQVKDVLVLPLHSWRFFGNGSLKQKMLDSWETLLKRLIASSKYRFCRFSEISMIG